jgi:hypothetical protein
MTIHLPGGAIACLIKVQLVALIAALLFGIAPGAGVAAPPNARIIAGQYFDLVLASGDLTAMAAVVAPNALLHTPEGEFKGYSGISDFSDTLGTAFANLTFSSGDVTVDGDYAAMRWTMSGTHLGNYGGVAATCTHVSVSGLAMLRFDDLQISEQWITYDRLALVQQLQALAEIDTHSQDACAPSAPVPTPDAPIPACGPECTKPRGNW